MLESKRTKNVCLVCNGTGLRSKKMKKVHLNPVDLCSNCGGVGSIRPNEGTPESKGLSKNAVVGLAVLGVLSVGAVAFFLSRKKDDDTLPTSVTQPEATTPEATTPEATTPEATTPEATAPEATTPETTTPEATPPVVLPPGFKPSEIISVFGVEMFLLPPGTFKDGDKLTKVENPFLLGKTEVTQELYRSVTGKNPSKFKNPKNPVESVTWFDCIEFCNELSELEGLDKCYSKLPSGEWSCDFGKNGYRLPTAGESKYAAKAGTDNAWAGTNDEKDLKNYAWYDQNSGNKTHPIGTRLPNEWGFYDMSGNVWEWCWDLYHPSNKKERSTHGGGYWTTSDKCKATFVWWNNDSYKNSNLGFRLCRSAV